MATGTIHRIKSYVQEYNMGSVTFPANTISRIEIPISSLPLNAHILNIYQNGYTTGGQLKLTFELMKAGGMWQLIYNNPDTAAVTSNIRIQYI